MIRWVQKYRAKQLAKRLAAWKVDFSERAKVVRLMLQDRRTVKFILASCLCDSDRDMFELLFQTEGEDKALSWIALQLNVSEATLKSI